MEPQEAPTEASKEVSSSSIVYEEFKDESQLPSIEALMTDLSEPYSILVYRYFLQNWPKYTLLVITEIHLNS